jgi:hypothetical protein
MQKLPLIFRSNWEQKESEINELERNFHTIILDNVTINSNKLAKVFKKIAANVKYFEMDGTVITHKSFADVLKSLKMVEKILISEVHVECEATKKIKAVNLKTLKSFSLISSDWIFFEYLNVANTLKELKIACRDVGSKLDVETFENFLADQTALETLAVKVRDGTFYKSLADTNYKFKIKKLSVDFKYWGNDPSIDEAFVAFLQQHQSTLEDFESGRTLSEPIVEFILKDLSLKRLVIDSTNLPSTPLFYNTIRPNRNLKTLMIESNLNKFDVARGLLQTFPMIETLKILEWENELLNETIIFIANNLKRLNFLQIPLLTTETPTCPIPSLKTLRVDFVSDVEQWQTLAVNNPSIEQIMVLWTTNRDIFTYEVLNDVTLRLPNLKHVKFGAYFQPTVRILEMMERNCRLLHTVEVFNSHSESAENFNLNINKLRVMTYRQDSVSSVFPSEPSLWDDEAKYQFPNVSEFDSSEDDDDDDDMSIDNGITDDSNEDADWDDGDGGNAEGFYFYY